LDAADTITTNGGLRVGWINGRDRVFVGEETMRAQGWDLVATVTPRKVILGGAHIDSGVSLGALHGTHDVDGVRLQVAGHDTPIAITPLDRATAIADFPAAVRGLIINKL
jgi:hypothetical protein